MDNHMISYVDAHVAGEPLRLITGGILLKGESLVEKREYMMRHYDYVRAASMLEPRGHSDMYGAVLTEPTDPKADLAVIFIDSALYNNMCGHGSIAIGTIAVELGWVPTVEPVTTVILETPAGLVKLEVEIDEGSPVGTTLHGVPSFLYQEKISLDLNDKVVLVDLVYGGNFFGMVDIKQLGLSHSVAHLDEYIKLGKEIRGAINEGPSFSHPEKPYIRTVDDILFVDDPSFKGDTYKSLCFLGDAQIDRSPCGTGTCARMAALYQWGILKKGEVFYHESIIGTVFEGMISAETTVGKFSAILPTVKANAYIINMGTLLLNNKDPLRAGFSIK
ncbi:MAG: hypothetical protein AVO34_10715 [Firmicutes bacterium ML8_F2]|nr:MAG: hypothetical protein AVO34_10715 [Firmicutes bacterium ML8_F2]